MSPEQALGEDIDGRSDLFSLGVVLYEMASGKQPFMGATTAAIFDAILHRAPQPLADLNPALPPELNTIVARLLEKDRAARYGTAAELKIELARLKRRLESGDTQPQPTVATRAKTRAVRIGAAIAILAAIAVLAWAVFAPRARPAAPGAAAGIDVEKLRDAAAGGRVDEVSAIVQAGNVDLTASWAREVLAPALGAVTLESTPPGADASLARLRDGGIGDSLTFHPLGRTPLKDVPVVAGEYVLRMQQDTLQPADALVRVKARENVSVTVPLPPASAPPGFALVPAGAVAVQPGVRVDAFLIGRREVTNAEFLAFVGAGGYRNGRFWPATLELEGRVVPWTAAASKFVDRTGISGPRFWAGGTYPAGKADHPVVGVTWHEAAAYARFAEMDLPGWAEWWRAALAESNAAFPWGDDVNTAEVRANFGLIGTTPAGQLPGGMSPFGCYDMAGNVREWLRDSVPGTSRRRVVGGSWQDPSYMFEASHAELFEPGFANDAIGFRLVRRATAIR
jgi:eukaryotic-like serine/threonine-protein kinase